MKLKNRKTGVIGELVYESEKEYHFTVDTGDAFTTRIYKKLADLYEEWEDYEEPEEVKKVWFIDADGELASCTQECEYDECGLNAGGMKSVGNYFETEEEARKAVEKLKAWKRLKKDLVSLSWQPERDGEFSVWGSFNLAGDIQADIILDNRRNDLDVIFLQEAKNEA